MQLLPSQMCEAESLVEYCVHDDASVYAARCFANYKRKERILYSLHTDAASLLAGCTARLCPLSINQLVDFSVLTTSLKAKFHLPRYCYLLAQVGMADGAGELAETVDQSTYSGIK